VPAPLTRAARTQGGGEALPAVFRTLEHAGVKPRRGQITMFFGIPGCGKTFLALLWALRLNLHTLFFSLDTDPGTMRVRTIAYLTGEDQNEVEKKLQAGGDFDKEISATNIDYSFQSYASLTDIDLEIKAYAEIHGAYPELIIVDNLVNVSADSDDEWAGMRELMKAFHSLTRQYGCAVWVLHHAKETGKTEECPPRSEIQGKVAQYPELIIAVGQRAEHRAHTGVQLGVACVKNRRGKADPSGRTAHWFTVDMGRMKLFETSYEALADKTRGEYT
jgi:RecA-family ATPase